MHYISKVGSRDPTYENVYSLLVYCIVKNLSGMIKFNADSKISLKILKLSLFILRPLAKLKPI